MRREVEVEPDSRFARASGDGLYAVRDDARQIDRLFLEGESVVPELREIEQIIEQREETEAGGLDRGGVVRHAFGITRRAVANESSEADNRVQRRAQFVRHMCKKLGLRTRSRGGVPQCLLQLAFAYCNHVGHGIQRSADRIELAESFARKIECATIRRRGPV